MLDSETDNYPKLTHITAEDAADRLDKKPSVMDEIIDISVKHHYENAELEGLRGAMIYLHKKNGRLEDMIAELRKTITRLETEAKESLVRT